MMPFWFRVAVAIAWSGAVHAVSLAEQTAQLLRELQDVHGLTERQAQGIQAIFTRSRFAGQGNPAISVHPLTREQCRAKFPQPAVSPAGSPFEKICGARHMAPLYDSAVDMPEAAKTCIDQFEFPNIPCAYPVVWVRANEAALICKAMGKRLCDAHEWEGACAGRLEPPDYRFDLSKGVTPDSAVSRMRAAHNRVREGDKSWSYGPTYQSGVCGTGTQKTAGCVGGGWTQCGSNTYPAGSFPGCRSPLGVYDLHGNAAEHMNLPLSESQMASRGSQTLGVTEMKGSWFIFDAYRAHEDWCRWRAPYWHGSRVMDERSHANYHLGFRCCKTLEDR
ncbi:MAG: SUMF1/EgtB/PvdO family nonheme iron enzyme [Burkholderiales bacterium]